MSDIDVKKFGTFQEKDVILVTLLGENGCKISFMNWGASVQNWDVRDNQNRDVSVVLGFDNFEHYPSFSPFFGAIVGRVINRTSKGKFSLDGIDYQLSINRPPNHLHGGSSGFGTSLWDFKIDNIKNSITFSIESKDGHEGYPGNVSTSVK